MKCMLHTGKEYLIPNIQKQKGKQRLNFQK